MSQKIEISLDNEALNGLPENTEKPTLIRGYIHKGKLIVTDFKDLPSNDAFNHKWGGGDDREGNKVFSHQWGGGDD